MSGSQLRLIFFRLKPHPRFVHLMEPEMQTRDEQMSIGRHLRSKRPYLVATTGLPRMLLSFSWNDSPITNKDYLENGSDIMSWAHGAVVFKHYCSFVKSTVVLSVLWSFGTIRCVFPTIL